MKRFLNFLSLGGMTFFLLACNDEGAAPDPDPCETNPPVINNIEVSNAGCNASGGTLLVQAGGGNGSLSYSLNGTDFQTGNNFTELAPGRYTVTVQDEENCQVLQEAEVEETSALGLEIASRTESGCGETQGMVRLEAQGGEGSYTYSLDGTTFQEEGEFEQLAAGAYTAHVKDAAGCVLSEDFEIQTGISFNNSVKTIIETNCAVYACHVSGTGRANFEEFSQIQEHASTIKAYTQNGTMPPEDSGRTLTDSEIQAIACWVEDGAPQN